jgi:tetratricopeptide (TPR) repeat protein
MTMDDKQEGFPDDFSQEVDDLIDATMSDENSARAVKRMEEAIQSGIPKSQLSSAYLILGTRYEDLDQIDKAIDCYSKSIQLWAKDPIVYFWRGELLFQQGRNKDARLDLETALLLSSPNSSYYSLEREQAQDLLKRIGQCNQ